MSAAGTVEVRRDGSRSPASRLWVPEAPVALEFNGLSYAVMMATPADLEDFATGFALSDGLAAHSGEVTDIIVKSGPSDSANAKAVEAVRKIQFLPAEKDGRKVSTLVTLQYQVKP